MAVASDNEKVEFSARIPRELYNEFREYFPGYGATTFLITHMLEGLLGELRKEPTMKNRVQKLIDAMVEENRANGKEV